VELFAAGSPKSIGKKKTNATGRYTFDRLPAGSYQVKFSLPTGLRFTGSHQGGNSAVDSDPDATGLSPVVVLGDDNPADTTVDAGLTTSASYQGSAAGADGAAPAADTSLSNTGGVEPAIPIGGLLLVGAGAACLVLARRRRQGAAFRLYSGWGSKPESDSESEPAPDR
jgi:hypothetical protein